MSKWNKRTLFDEGGKKINFLSGCNNISILRDTAGLNIEFSFSSRNAKENRLLRYLPISWVGEESWIHAFSKCISVKKKVENHLKDLNSVRGVRLQAQSSVEYTDSISAESYNSAPRSVQIWLEKIWWPSRPGLKNTPIASLQRSKTHPTSVLDMKLINLMVWLR